MTILTIPSIPNSLKLIPGIKKITSTSKEQTKSQLESILQRMEYVHFLYLQFHIQSFLDFTDFLFGPVAGNNNSSHTNPAANKTVLKLEYN
jgi:hypothetical protein